MRLLAVRAVPTPLLALDVQRAGEPGAPGGSTVSPFAIVLRLAHRAQVARLGSHASTEEKNADEPLAGPLDRRLCSTERSPPLLLRKNVTKGLHSFQAQMISADYAKYS
jgi:hypothetical protein